MKQLGQHLDESVASLRQQIERARNHRLSHRLRGANAARLGNTLWLASRARPRPREGAIVEQPDQYPSFLRLTRNLLVMLERRRCAFLRFFRACFDVHPFD